MHRVDGSFEAPVTVRSRPARTVLTQPAPRLADGHLSRPSPGMFHLWPLNGWFAHFGGSGGRVERMLRQAGLDVGAPVSIDSEIPAVTAVMLMRRTMRLSGDEMCGLSSRPIRLGTFAQACRVGVQATTVEQALRAAFRHYRGLVDDFQLRVLHEGPRVRIALIDDAPDRPGRDTMHLVVLHTLLAAVQWLSGRVGFVERVELHHPLVPRIEIQEAVFRARFVGEMPRTSLIVDRATLARSVVADAAGVDDFVASMLSRFALMFEDNRTVAERAVAHIRAQGDWDIGLQQIAGVFHMSADTFNRRLHDDVGVGFQEFKDRLRCAAAVEWLAHDDVHLDQIAQRLGFSELSTFHRAFKRWTGQRLGAYRDDLQGRGKASRAHAVCSAD